MTAGSGVMGSPHEGVAGLADCDLKIDDLAGYLLRVNDVSILFQLGANGTDSICVYRVCIMHVVACFIVQIIMNDELFFHPCYMEVIVSNISRFSQNLWLIAQSDNSMTPCCDL